MLRIATHPGSAGLLPVTPHECSRTLGVRAQTPPRRAMSRGGKEGRSVGVHVPRSGPPSYPYNV
jgi:hypothetical protein